MAATDLLGLGLAVTGRFDVANRPKTAMLTSSKLTSR